jgi:hypothetical protein
MLAHRMRVKTECWGEYVVLSRDSNRRMVESFIICTIHYINIINVIISRTSDGQCVWCTWESQAMQHFSRKSEKKRPLGGMTILKWNSSKGSIRMWTGFICLWIWSIGGTMCTEKWTFDFHKKRRIWLAKVILHSESGFVQSVCQLQKWLPVCYLNLGTIKQNGGTINVTDVG